MNLWEYGLRETITISILFLVIKSRNLEPVYLFQVVNDVAGHNAVHKYEKLYDIKGTWLDSSKDIADLVKEKGFDDAHKEIKVKLKDII